MQAESDGEPNTPHVPVVIDDVFAAQHVSAEILDGLWETGWRHQGIVFYRYSETDMGGVHHRITPLRIDLQAFLPSKSQRRVLRRNEDVVSSFEVAAFDDEMHAMFARHCERFTENVPESLGNFFSASPGDTPCACLAQRVSLNGQLIAVSFMDVGQDAASSVYAIFDPEHSDRSLGTYTMLKEIEYAQQHEMRWLYHGYATQAASHYDYKKALSAVEWLDWATGQWSRLNGL